MIAMHTRFAPLAGLRQALADAERPSGNHDARPAYVRGISCVVLHATADGGNEDGAETWLSAPNARVSAHLLIRRDGTVVRLVSDTRRAWHAGPSEWSGMPRVNDFSLGWELANRNDGSEPFSNAQYATVARLTAHYVEQGVPLDAFVSHASVALPRGRKSDPAGFDWIRHRAEVMQQLAVTQGLRPAFATPPTVQPGDNDMLESLRPLISRFAGALIGAAAGMLTTKLGIPIDAPSQASLTTAVVVAAYGIAHKLMDRKLNPADSALCSDTVRARSTP